LDGLNQKFDADKLELTYYDVKETIIDFFENMPVDEKRVALIKAIRKCQVFGKHMLIDTGKLLFVFNIDNGCHLPDDIWTQFKADEKFKDNFLNTSKLAEALKDDESFQKLMKSPDKKLLSDYFSARRLGEIRIFECPLHLKSLKEIITEKFNKLDIDYDLTGIDKIISFTEI